MSPFKRKELWKYITLHLNQTALPSPPTLSTSSSSSGWSECNRAGKAGGAKFAESNPRLSRVQRSQVVKSTPLILDNVFLIHVDCSTIFAMKASFRWIKRSGFFSQDVKTLHKRLDGQDTRNTKVFANISAKKSQWSDKSTDEKNILWWELLTACSSVSTLCNGSNAPWTSLRLVQNRRQHIISSRVQLQICLARSYCTNQL